MNNLLFGIDLGGTKLEGLVYDAESKKVHYRERIPTEAAKGYAHILSRIKILCEKMTTAVNVVPSCIGFGTPGKWDPQKNCIRNSNTVCFNGKPLKTDLESLLQTEIHISNDANCFVLAESMLGSAVNQEAEVVFGIIMGTGVGGGIVVRNALLNGLHGIAGEWGHNFLDDSGGKCYCGKTGCVETVLSGVALEKYFHSISGQTLALTDIVQLASLGNKAAINTMYRLHYYFGKALANVINILDPDTVIVGGGVGNIDSLYAEGVQAIHQFLFNDILETKIIKPAMGDSAGVFGAALLCRSSSQKPTESNLS